MKKNLLKTAYKIGVGVFSKKSNGVLLIEPAEILGDNENIMIVHIRQQNNPCYYQRTVWKRIDQ